MSKRIIYRFIAVLLVCTLFLCSCTPNNTEVNSEVEAPVKTSENEKAIVDHAEAVFPDFDKAPEENFESAEYIEYLEESLYSSISEDFSGVGLSVESVQARYVSEEYINENAYNSLSNIYFGYSLNEINEYLGDQKYVFAVGDDGKTTVKFFEPYDDTFEKIIENVAVGTGVILICVVISVASAGTAAPACIPVIFAAAAKGATIGAFSGAAIEGVVTGVVSAIEGNEWEDVLKESALAASNGFKWGAITGAITSGATETLSLKYATRGGLTINEAAQIKQEGLSYKVIRQIKSMDDYNELCIIAERQGLTIQKLGEICENTKYPLDVLRCCFSKEEIELYVDQAKLVSKTIGGRQALVRSIDLTYESTLPNGEIVTNLERMRRGYAAIDPVTELPYELHHIGQNVDSPLAILSWTEHHDEPNFSILHQRKKEGVQSLLGSAWDSQRKAFWKSFAEYVETLL